MKVGVNSRLQIKALAKQPLFKFEDLAAITLGLGVTNIRKNDAVQVKMGCQVDINL